MQCGFCHREVPDDSRFCPFCGHALGLRAVEPPPPPPPVVDPAVFEPARMPGLPPGGPVAPAGRPEPAVRTMSPEPAAEAEPEPEAEGPGEAPAVSAPRRKIRPPAWARWQQWEGLRGGLTLDRVLFGGALAFAVIGFLWGIARPVTGLEWIAFGLVLMEAARFLRG